ncbi:uncharacterized protein IAS62_001484 [Cryptococcus decagattii]|uniref:t-SNARE coiled-coil homology domain-containing protein n=1 Tax=Cryptococcus decagattii TaxID=1859122 RepID=A0ABZ2ASL4_9TREE
MYSSLRLDHRLVAYLLHPFDRVPQRARVNFQNLLMEVNDERLEGLLGKVKILKDITTGIGNEVRDSNIQLGNMNDTFSSTSSFLSGTFKRMNKMAKRQGGNWCWLMMFLLFVLWIFVVLWWLRR